MAARNTTPIYIQVAVDVAGRVSSEELKVGQKISGRSTFASEYNVSPETIRKAMGLLQDVNIVEVKHGNGVYVSSVERAEEFIERYRIKATVNELKEDLLDLMQQRNAIEQKMNDTMNSIIDYTSRFKNSDHITVHEYSLNFVGDAFEVNLDSLNLRSETGVTVVGVKRGGDVRLSPGPDETIKTGDKRLNVGAPAARLRLGEYLRGIFED